MSSLDVRTRGKADIRQIGVAAFFERTLLELIAARAGLAVDGARLFDLRPLTFLTDSGAWTLSRADNSFAVSRDDTGISAVRLDDGEFSDLVNDILTPVALLSSGRLRIERGSLDDIDGWWAVLRALVDGRTVLTPGAIVLRDRQGQPLDTGRSFAWDDDDEDIAHFLREAGYLHLSGWLDTDLMQEIEADMDREFPLRTPDDGSWWATLGSGEKRAVRIPGFAALSPAVRRLLASDAYRRIARLTDDGYEHAIDVEALVKPLDVVSGISNLPWHNDCSQGLHSYNCCNLVVGISVTGAGPEAGQLAVLPGSHRALMPTHRLYARTGLEPLHVTTQTGDMTVHCSCTMHMSRNPTRLERKVLYTGFSLPQRDPDLSAEIRKMIARRDAVHQVFSESPAANAPAG